MAAEDKTILIKIEVQEAQAKVNIKKLESSIKSLDGRTKEYTLAVKKLASEELKLQQIQSNKVELNKKMALSNNQLSSSVTGVSRSSGAAAATTLELGRVISDMPYGIRGVANNLSQVASQMAFMSTSTNNAKGAAIGFSGALKAVWSSMMGPLGILLAIQAGIAALDFFAGSTKKAEEGLESFEGESITSTVAKLSILRKAINDVNISLEDKISLLDKATSEFDELKGSTVETSEGIDSITLALDGMISKMKEVAFAKAVLDSSTDLMKDFAKQLVMGVEGFGESFSGSAALFTDALGITFGAADKKFNDTIQKTGKGINDLYNILTQKQADGSGILAELLFGKDSKNGKKASQRVNKIFKESIFSLQKEINKFVKDNEKLITKNVFDLLAIDQEAERESIELKRTSYLEKEYIRHQNFLQQEAARRKMTVEEFKQTKEGLESLATVEKIYINAGLERDKAIAALEILQIQETNDLKLKLFEKYQDESDKLRLKRAEREVKSSGSFGVDEAGTLGSPVSNGGAGNIEEYERQQRELWAIEDELALERFNDKSIELFNNEVSLIDQEIILGDMRLEQQQNIADREVQLEIDKINAKKNVNQEYVSWTQGLATIFKNISGDNEQLAKAALIIEKGAAIADIVVKTTAANQAVLVASSAKAAAGVPGAMATGKARIVKNKIGAGISIASILSTSLKTKGLKSGGGSGGSGGAASQDRTFDFNLVGNTGVNQLAQGIAGQFSGPVQAYVVASQVTSQQQLDATIQSNATIG